jgi:2-succinyl-5-enolpyruvyl-6-hydroxy-3-cyclohexene-1-carboxylate synthase
MKDLVFSMEKDPFFNCYSVVDERSAAYFAMGISQELNVPVGVICTSATATCNYLPAIAESFYQGSPLLVITGDGDPYTVGERQDQIINQHDMYHNFIKKSVTLPLIKDEDDCWRCESLVNEALLELTHKSYSIGWPVHINVPVLTINSMPYSMHDFPDAKMISRISLYDSNKIEEKVRELEGANKILVIAGQNCQNKRDIKNIEMFFKRYNCVIATEYMSNLMLEGALNIFAVSNTISLRSKALQNLLPDIIISFDGYSASSLKSKLRFNYKKIKHWLINEDGSFIDIFKCLSVIFECKPSYFFEYFANHANPKTENNMTYYDEWKKICNQMRVRDNIPYSNVSVILEFLKVIPGDSLLHLSINNSIRISHQYSNLPPTVKVYANIGTYGIDGSMSTFFGQSVVCNSLAFLIIGDLSFFYDMSSLRVKHIKSNVRILLLNNGGGAEFYYNGLRPDTLDTHIAARHNTTAKAWSESVGFKYITAGDEAEFLKNLKGFTHDTSEEPILFEVFTDMATDADVLLNIEAENRKRICPDDLKVKIESLVGANATAIAARKMKPILDVVKKIKGK